MGGQITILGALVAVVLFVGAVAFIMFLSGLAVRSLEAIEREQEKRWRRRFSDHHWDDDK